MSLSGGMCCCMETSQATPKISSRRPRRSRERQGRDGWLARRAAPAPVTSEHAAHADSSGRRGGTRAARPGRRPACRRRGGEHHAPTRPPKVSSATTGPSVIRRRRAPR